METKENDSQYKKLLASVPDPFNGEDLETMLKRLNSYHYCLVDRESTASCAPGESPRGTGHYVDKVLAKLGTYADGTTYVPDGDIPFVAPHGCVDAIREISRENAKTGGVNNVFLREKQREWMEKLVKLMSALNKQHKFDFKEFTNSLNNSADIGDIAAVPIPLEILWWLHDSGLLLLTTYIYDNLDDMRRLGELKDSLLSLVCCFDSTDVKLSHTIDVDDPDQVPVERRMVKDLLGCLLSASQRTQLKCSKACSILLDSVMKKALSRLTHEGNTDPPGNYLRVLRQDPLVGGEDLRAFAGDVLYRFFTVNPNVTLTSALVRHAEWLYDMAPRHVTDFVRDVLQILGIPHVLKILQSVLNEAEVNWKHVLVAVSTFVVCVKGASKHVKALVASLVEDSLNARNKETLASALLLVRHCCLEPSSHFPSYAAWFGATFGRESTSLAFSFLVGFLQELVPYEPAVCLRAHIGQPPAAPQGMRHLVSEYAAVARTRLVDLDQAATSSLLGTDSIDSDVLLVAKHFRETGQLYPPLLGLATLLRQPFERELVPRLLAGGHRRVVAKLVGAGRLTQQAVDRLRHTRAPGPAAAPAPPPGGEDKVRPLLAGAAERLKVTCNLHGDLGKVVASLAEKLPLGDRGELEFAREFGSKYLSLADGRSDLSKPPSLVKKTLFACERLRCYDRGADVSVPRPNEKDETSFAEWLDFESALRQEFLGLGAKRLYLRKAMQRHLKDYRDTFFTLVDKLLETPDRWTCLDATVAGLVEQILPTESDRARGIPVLLDKWSKLSCNHSHETFFSIAQLLPEWLLFTDSLAHHPTQETVQTIAQLINVDLLDVLSHENVLRPEFVSYLMMGLDRLRSTFGADQTRRLLDSLLDSCMPFHLALLVHYKEVECFLNPLFPPESDAVGGPLGRMRSLLGGGSGLEADTWEAACVAWYHRPQQERGRGPVMWRWLFFLRLLSLGHALNAATATFTLADGRLWFVSDDVERESPLQVLEWHLRESPPAITALRDHAVERAFSAGALRLAGAAGLLFLVERRLSPLVATAPVMAALPPMATAFFAALADGLGPAFLWPPPEEDERGVRERRELLDYVRTACREMIGRPAPHADRDQQAYLIDDDDILEIPDHLP